LSAKGKKGFAKSAKLTALIRKRCVLCAILRERCVKPSVQPKKKAHTKAGIFKQIVILIFDLN
jgi:hypothetical protein